MTKSLSLLFIFQIIFILSSLGQEVKNVSFKQEGENIVISYDLQGQEGARFNVKAFYLADGERKPITLASGDVGDNKTIGIGKRIIWNAKDDLKGFKGNLQVDVEATLTFSPIVITSLLAGKQYKAKSKVHLTWTGGLDNENVRIGLYRGDNLFQAFGDFPNTRKRSVVIPESTQDGGNYNFKLTGSDNIPKSTGFFNILTPQKSSKKFIFIIGGAALLGTTVAVLASGGGNNGGGGGTTPTTPVNNDLPAFPALPSGQ